MPNPNQPLDYAYTMILVARHFILLFVLYGLTVCDMGIAYATDTQQQSRNKEQSTANKILGAATIGTTGMGTMMAAGAMAERAADDNAEQDIRAYLATFKCNYGDGNVNIRGGETNIELPGGNALSTLATEYMTLAASIKTRKNALGMAPGIEATEIVDAAASGLYDDVGAARGDGAFASISRALKKPNGTDAANIKQQQDATSKKLQTGATMALGGVAFGIAGNTLINTAGDGTLRGVFMRDSGVNNKNNIIGAGAPNTVIGGMEINASNNYLDGDMGRISNACDTLRSDISVRADNVYDQILAIQATAASEEIDTTSIDAAISSAEVAKEAIATAQSAADNAMAAAQKIDIPEQDACELDFDEDAPMIEDYEDDQDGYNKDKAAYDARLKRANEKLNICEQNAKSKYDKELKKYQATIKKYVDDAERRLSIGRTELGKMERALSNAENAKNRGITAKEQAAAAEAAAAKKAEDLQQQISDQVSLAQDASERARAHYDAARNIADQVNAEMILDESEEDAMDQLSALKTSADDDIEKAKTATETAEKQIKTATNAATVRDAQNAVSEAARQESIAAGRLDAIKATLEKIKAAKATAREKYLAAQQQDSEEEIAETEED